MLDGEGGEGVLKGGGKLIRWDKEGRKGGELELGRREGGRGC